jgi:MFS family permease
VVSGNRLTSDRLASLVVVFAFSVGLGVATLAIPLLALDAGYDAAAVGFLVATSAASQLVFRLCLPWLLRRFADRTLTAVASLLMLAGFAMLLVSTVVAVFVIAQLLQGAARAIFWTSSQTHAVRGDGRPVDRLVEMNVAGNAGTLIGPVVAGSLAVFGLPVAIASAAVGAAVAAAGTTALRRLPAYDRHRPPRTSRLLRRDGMDVACWASVVGGGWWAMLGSYIPVILVSAAVGSQGIGWLITLSEAASIAGILLLRRLATGHVRGAVQIGSFTAAAVLAGLAVAPAGLIGYAALLIVGGVASGTITTLAPAMASLAATPEEQGDALALTGTFRAAALLAAPAAVGALLSVFALPIAVVALGSAPGLPGIAIGRGPIEDGR